MKTREARRIGRVDYNVRRLLSGPESNPKIIKDGSGGLGEDWLIDILHLFPSDGSGVINVCPWATPGCREACLGTKSGRAGLREDNGTNTVLNARRNRTTWFAKDRESFLSALRAEIERHITRARRIGARPALRLNGTSDLPFERMGVIEEHPDVVFYDYTKSRARMLDYLAGRMPSNYHLTFSAADGNDAAARDILQRGGNVTVVFDSPEFPAEYWGAPVHSADDDDKRFLDDERFGTGGKVMALTFKVSNRLKKYETPKAVQSGFVKLTLSA